MPTARPDIRLILTTEHDDFSHILRASLAVHYYEGGELLYPTWQSFGDTSGMAPYADLRITAQSDGAEWYGFDIAYRHVYSIDRDRVKTMSAALGRIERHTAKLTDRFGYPADFGEYCGRIADAAGVTNPSSAFGKKVPPERDISGSGYQWGSVDSLRWWLADAVKPLSAGITR